MRHHQAREADLLIGIVQVLIADEAEELVLDERAAERAAGGIAMQLRNFVVGGIFGSSL